MSNSLEARLRELGLDRTTVTQSLGSSASEELPPTEPDPPKRYLTGNQAEVWEQLRRDYAWIVAQAVRGVPSRTIAAGMGVSRETIDRRLRPLGLKNPKGKRGRPKSEWKLPRPQQTGKERE